MRLQSDHDEEFMGDHEYRQRTCCIAMNAVRIQSTITRGREGRSKRSWRTTETSSRLCSRGCNVCRPAVTAVKHRHHRHTLSHRSTQPAPSGAPMSRRQPVWADKAERGCTGRAAGDREGQRASDCLYGPEVARRAGGKSSTTVFGGRMLGQQFGRTQRR